MIRRFSWLFIAYCLLVIAYWLLHIHLQLALFLFFGFLFDLG